MDGYTLCQQVKKISRLQAIPTIMLTGEEKLTAQVKARNCGAADFIFASGKTLTFSEGRGV